jgi:hypothetical protein
VPKNTVREDVASPFTTQELARAIRWATEWYTHAKGHASPQARAGVLLLQGAAEDYAYAAGAGVERTVFSGAWLKANLQLESEHGEERVTSLARDLADSLDNFRHYHRAGKQWYEFSFVGPTPKARGVRIPTLGKAADYYLAVEYRRIRAGAVPDDRRHHRPGHLQRALGRAIDGGGFQSSIPNSTPDFMGRAAELRRFLRIFAHPEDRVVVAALEGLPGVGKTELVAAASTALLNRYPDVHVYLSAAAGGEPRTIGELLHDALDQLETEPGRARPITLETLAARYRALLTGRRCLIVCENVTEYDQVARLVPPKGSALIVSSRGPLAVPGARVYELAPFAEANARAYLLRAVDRLTEAPTAELSEVVARAMRLQVPTPVATTIADLIAQLCGRLPLALQICARYLTRHPDVTLERFVRYFVNEHNRVSLTSSSADSISVEASFNLTYRRLDPEEQQGFSMLGVFPGSFVLEAAEHVLRSIEPKRDRPHSMVSDLVASGLVRWDAPRRRYILHDLLRAFARTRVAPDAREAALSRLVTFVHGLGAHRYRAYSAGFVDEQLETEALVEEDRPTLEVVMEALLERIETSDDALYAASDIVSGFAPALLQRSATLLKEWSGALAASFAPLADVQYSHSTTPQHELAPSLRPSETWGEARSRWATHAFDTGLAAEQSGDDEGALAIYRFFAALPSFGVAGDRLPGLHFRCRERAVRILRRGRALPGQTALAIGALLADRPTVDGIEALMHAIVYAADLAAGGNDLVAAEVVRGLLANWRAVGGVPWAAALYWDAVSEVPSAWRRATLRYVAQDAGDPPTGRIGLYALSVARAFERDDILTDVAAFLDERTGARAHVPIEIGRILFDIRPREAYVFFAELLRVLEATHDSAALREALWARAVMNESAGQLERAREDLLRLQENAADAETERVAQELARVDAALTTRRAKPAMTAGRGRTRRTKRR